jgi:hypothetical protein
MHEEPEGSGHFVSVKNADLVRKQDEAKRKTSLVYAKESTINKVQRDKDNEDKSSVTAAGGEHSGKDELEEEAKAHLLALEKRNMATLAMRRGSNTNAVNMGGRGGAIRRPSATPVDDDNSDGEHASETKAEDLPPRAPRTNPDAEAQHHGRSRWQRPCRSQDIPGAQHQHSPNTVSGSSPRCRPY